VRYRREALKKVVFCTPSLAGPTAPYIRSLEASVPLIEAAGWEHGYAQQINCPYISAARANMTRSALDAKADVIVYLDFDLSWDAPDLLKLLEAEGDVVAGTYRPQIDDEQYMGTILSKPDGTPLVRVADGAIAAKLIPAGFLKLTANAIDVFMVSYPELCYGPMYHLSVDLFNHGVSERIWWGEDYSFARRWKEKCGDIWIVPNLNIDHWKLQLDSQGRPQRDENDQEIRKPYRGNFHKFLLRQPGGSNDPERKEINEETLTAV
jgi:hypothetical protein